MKKLITLLFIGFNLFFIQNVFASPFSITENQINQYLSKKGEFADKLGIPSLFFIDYQLNDLHTKIGQQNSERIEIEGSLNGLFQFGKQKIPAKLNLAIDTIPYYNSDEGAVYLKQMRILRWSGEPSEYMEKMQTIMPFLNKSIAALLETIPVYKLDDSNMRDALIKKFAKGIRVEKGQLSLETSVF